ncbi:hypothetical protein HUA74_05120 [Myxococcus sp. CA051A]|uniref:DUF3108 domain-containing protein n=1 Tax=Myxococcus llanfairpwllgwyngyllgogerychwyrndrobwllllantysiliogogogochensis TaxID=2590453 RepID=A0A540WWT4_9BACT|nr:MULTISPECIES: DUF3108 domain-containing protein [Myxococcus]NTX60034.1 hypothetical protein [Myxococcus sp. CA051A]TQF13456.1 DUF3108 domain-containing protein [Myxococcus llanfairpwllgwyngyllgogerychwyrndrobwllllantysiliogogogochensis]
MGASPTPEVTPRSDTQAVEAPAPCPHPYFPLEEGLTLTYRAGKSSQMVISTHGVTPTPEGLRGKVAVKLKGRQGETDATCTAEGMSTGLGGLEGTLLSASGMDVQVVSSEGMAVPALTSMVPGGSWKNSLSVKLQPPAGKTGGIRPIIATTFEKESTVVGEEEVTVAAGTFKALKVKNIVTARASRPGSEGRSMESYVWFAPGVGILKFATAESTDLELLKVERPQPVQAKSSSKARRPVKKAAADKKVPSAP